MRFHPVIGSGLVASQSPYFNGSYADPATRTAVALSKNTASLPAPVPITTSSAYTNTLPPTGTRTPASIGPLYVTPTVAPGNLQARDPTGRGGKDKDKKPKQSTTRKVPQSCHPAMTSTELGGSPTSTFTNLCGPTASQGRGAQGPGNAFAAAYSGVSNAVYGKPTPALRAHRANVGPSRGTQFPWAGKRRQEL